MADTREESSEESFESPFGALGHYISRYNVQKNCF